MATKATTKSVEVVKLSLIDPDPLQPRKSFDAKRLGELAASIKEHGIMNPLIVEAHGNGRYILVDGERRFRASKQLKLTEVPVVVSPSQDATQRLIQQFHLQEQHQGWSATEKAVAVSALAKNLGYSIRQMAQLLSLPDRTISDYVAFANLLNVENFQKNEIPVAYARHMVALRKAVRRLWMDHNEEFNNEMEEALELALISRVKGGDIRNMSDFAKIRDSFATDHKSVVNFIKDSKMSTDALYLKTNAKAAMHARLLTYAFTALANHAKQVRALGAQDMINFDSETIKVAMKEVHALGIK